MNIFNDDLYNCWFIKNSGSLIGAIISGLFAISILVVGRLLERRSIKKKEIKKLQETEAYLEIQIKNLDESSKRQVETIKQFLLTLLKDKEIDFEINLISGFNPSELFYMDHDELFKVLVYKRRGDISSKAKAFSIFRNMGLLLIDIKKDISHWIIDYQMKLNLYESKYKSYLGKIEKEYEKLNIEYEKLGFNSSQDPFLKKWNQINIDYHKIEGYTDMFITHNEFLIYLRQLILNAIKSKDLRVIHINRIVKKTIFYFDNYKKTKQVCYNQFLYSIRKIRQCDKEINIAFKTLISNKLKA